MKSVSEKFKNEIKQYGRQIDTIITYNDGEEHLLDMDVLFSIAPTVNGNILKSVMKQLDFESSVKIPKGTIINVKFGVQIDLSLTVAEVNEMKVSRLNEIPVNLLSAYLRGFEYINLGNYIVSEEPEYNADTLSYSHVCYDKMLYSMKDYEKLAITYPITVREYINKICEYLGLTFKNINDIFANYDKQIKLDLYDGYDYTFRDILDELAQVTASTICINEDTDELEIRYLNDTQDTIDEDYLKDVNVEFGEKYGPINSIVLSRSGESDNVFLQNEQSIQANGLCELKIIDNQIMNDNDRSDFLPDILDKLNGLQYYINDFSSPGITWYELCDKYTVQIGDNQYDCVLFNDEIKITQGLEETIYTEMPEASETDYSKADKTDRKINKAYIIVDKQNQKIEALISQQTEQSSKLTQVEQTVDSISQKVENIEDVTNKVSGVKSITLENCAKGNLLELHILGNNTVFDYLYPSDDLYPSDTLYPYGDSRIEVINFADNSEEGTSKIYELGITEVLRQNEEVYDEYILKDGKASIIRRVNKDGTTKASEEIEDLGDYQIDLLDGTNIIIIKNYTASLNAKFAIRNTYTDKFATKVEMNSSITQTAKEINMEVRKKVDENEIISKINQSAEQISIEADKINLNGTISANGNFKIDKEGNMEAKNGKFTGGSFTIGGDEESPDFIVQDGSGNYVYIVPNGVSVNFEDGTWASIDKGGFGCGSNSKSNTYGVSIFGDEPLIRLYDDNNNWTYIKPHNITTPSLTQTSLESIKKNISLYNEDVLELIKNAEIYSYNLKSEKDTDKKHIGFVIGNKYKTPNQVIAQSGDGIDTYAMTSLLWKAVQELTEEIEKLKGGQANG